MNTWATSRWSITGPGTPGSYQEAEHTLAQTENGLNVKGQVSTMSQTTAGGQAESYFAKGYVCSQALLMAFAPRFGLDLQMGARIAAPFGAGTGRSDGMCGAVTGALMVIGLEYGHETSDDTKAKSRTLELTGEFLRRFEARNGTVECRKLLGRDISDPAEMKLANAEGLFKTRCPGFVRDAAEIVEGMLGTQ